jgi:PDZ domain-containing protein
MSGTSPRDRTAGERHIEDTQDRKNEAQGHEDEDDENKHPLIVDRLVVPAKGLRLGRLILAGALAGAVTFGMFWVGVPLVTVEPGPTADANSLVRIEGAETFSPQGRHLVTTVLVVDRATIASALWGWVLPEVDVVPRSTIYPKGSTQQDIDREVADQMNDSQVSAKVAALRALGHIVPQDGLLVRRTLRGTPAARELKAGDVFTQMDGFPIRDLDDWGRALESRRIGENVTLQIEREGVTLSKILEVVTLSGAPQPDLGLEVAPAYDFPFEVTIDAREIGGPSAGLTFALTIAELLTPQDLTRGRTIADTGTIDDDGTVGAVGGVEQKVVSAKRKGVDIFLVPRANYAEAKRAAGNVLRVIPVSNLREALEALKEPG